jgi:negative regulator of sigma E activity
MKRTISLLLAVSLGATALRADSPSAQQILEQVRLQQSQQQLDLHGQLRTDARVIPFRITQTGAIIRYTFYSPPQVLQLKLGEEGSHLDVVHETSTEKFSKSRLDDRIGGMAVTYGDLALKFLYWPHAEILGEEVVRTRPCWEIRLQPPSRDAQYSNILLWVDKQSGAMMRIQAYDWEGRLTKRFEVVSAQKINGRWFLKEMRIEDLQPGVNKVLSRTYLDIQKPE